MLTKSIFFLVQKKKEKTISITIALYIKESFVRGGSTYSNNGIISLQDIYFSEWIESGTSKMIIFTHFHHLHATSFN